jgi:RNA polymerase sigma-70 factor (ECF subfamily)
MELGDEELLRRVGSGDRRAFEIFYARHAPWLTLRLRRRCRDPELVADRSRRRSSRSGGRRTATGEVVRWSAGSGPSPCGV